MGFSKKEEIARLKKERRTSKAAKSRRVNTRVKRARFLIVCEGEQTEPNYFKALIDDRASVVRDVYIDRGGCATITLVKRALEIKTELEKENDFEFDRVWVVFDKDDFQDFNEAIKLAKTYKFKSAWSNEAFELWYYLHFEYLDTAIGRHDYIKKLQDLIRKKTDNSNFKYHKNDQNFYALLQQIGKEDLAKRFAERLRKMYKGHDFASQCPRTEVDLLVDELENSEKLLNI